MQWVKDSTQRFVERPLFFDEEIQERVEAEWRSFFSVATKVPVGNNELELFADMITEHYDPEANLVHWLGVEVEGVTIFKPGRRPKVKISSALLTEKLRRRRRMTIAHEIGHVLLHTDLYVENRTLDLFADSSEKGAVYCKENTMLPGSDWMEWQASYAAGCLLMPTAAVCGFMTQLRGSRVQEPLYLDMDESDKVVTALANHFDVSFEASTVRLSQLRFIEPSKAIQRLPLY